MAEIDIDHDNLCSHLERWKAAEKLRAVGAAETRQEIGQFIEDTGLNKKGLAMIRALDKLDDDKRTDVLATFDALRDELQPQWDGQGTPDMFSGALTPAGDDDMPDGGDPDEDYADDPFGAQLAALGDDEAEEAA